MQTPIPERLARIETLPLKRGSHESNDDLDMCTMEMVAWIAGEPWSDKPQCACPVITGFCVLWNDSLPSDEARDRLLKPLVPLIVGTRSTPNVEETRAYMVLDWLIRVHTPKWLDLVPSLQGNAKALRELDAIVDLASATAAGVTTSLAAKGANTARDVAWDAAGDAARAAAWAAARVAARATAWAAAGAAAADAAWDAAGDAAGSTAGDAAWDAARDAAGSTARDAAWDVLRPTTEWLQSSAVGLVKRMCEVKA